MEAKLRLMNQNAGKIQLVKLRNIKQGTRPDKIKNGSFPNLFGKRNRRPRSQNA
jgi:hypothetical protein